MSSKRGAEMQLNKDNFDAPDDDDGAPPSTGFARATEDVIARRQIKAPKSRLKTMSGDSAAPNAFANAFKAPAAAPSAGFSFGGATSTSAAAPAPFGGFSFGSGGSGSSEPPKSAAPSFGFSFGATTGASSSTDSSSGDKPAAPVFKFGSTAGTAPSLSFGAAKDTGKDSQSAAPPAFSFSPPSTAPADKPTFVFGAAVPVSNGLSNGPVFGAKAASTESETPKPAFGGFTFGSSAPKTETNLSAPAPPVTFGGFSAPKADESAAPASAPTFTFGAPKQSASALPTPPVAPVFGSNPAPTFGSAPASKTAPSESDAEACLSDLLALNRAYIKFLQKEVDADDFVDLAAAVSQYTTFRKGIEDKYPDVIKLLKESPSSAPSSAVTTVATPLEIAPEQPKAAATAEAPKLTFGAPPSSAMDMSAAPKAPLFSFVPASTAAATPAASGGFAFSAPTSAPTAPAGPTGFKLNLPGSGEAPKFSFGAAASGPTFGSAPTFGASFGAGSGSTAPSFPVFGASAPMTGSKDEGGDGEEGDDDGMMEQEEPQADPTKFKKGAGEEDEETVYEIRAGIYGMKEGKIAKLGVGLAKINVDNETKKSRVLVRTDNSTVILNQALHAHINPSIQPDAKGNQKTVRFIGIAEGKPSPFTLNVGDEKEAVKLKDLLEEYKAKA